MSGFDVRSSSPSWHRDEALAAIAAVELVSMSAEDDDGTYDDEHEETAGEAKDVIVSDSV